VCEAAGFDVVLIETVGVGQSETIVSQISDVFALLLAPAGGDELQGVKRGIMEMADLVLVNKADGDLKPAAMRTCADFSGALRLLRKRPQDPEDYPKVLTVSAITEMGLEVAWEAMQALSEWRRSKGHFDRQRALQARFWFDEDVKQSVLASLMRADVVALMQRIGQEVENGDILPEVAAAKVLGKLKLLG
jgi:LAO/AO transport system kinase